MVGAYYLAVNNSKNGEKIEISVNLKHFLENRQLITKKQS